MGPDRTTIPGPPDGLARMVSVTDPEGVDSLARWRAIVTIDVPPAPVHSYAYRTPRIDIDLPVEFLVGTAVLFGLTKNVSEKGLLVDFGEPLAPGTTGKTRFRIGRCVLELDARVTHNKGFTAGLEFEFSSEQERFFLTALVQVITERASVRAED